MKKTVFLYNDLMKMDCLLCLADLENYEPGDENVDLVEMLLDLTENVKLRKVDKEGVIAYISIKDSHPDISKHVEASIISFPTTWVVESGFSAALDVFSGK